MHFEWEIVCVEIRQSTPFNFYESISAFVLANTQNKKNKKAKTRRRRDKWKRRLQALRLQRLILLAVFMALFRITIKLTVLWRVDSSHTYTHSGTHMQMSLDSFLWKMCRVKSPQSGRKEPDRTTPNQTKPNQNGTKRAKLKWGMCPTTRRVLSHTKSEKRGQIQMSLAIKKKRKKYKISSRTVQKLENANKCKLAIFIFICHFFLFSFVCLSRHEFVTWSNSAHLLWEPLRIQNYFGRWHLKCHIYMAFLCGPKRTTAAPSPAPVPISIAHSSPTNTPQQTAQLHTTCTARPAPSVPFRAYVWIFLCLCLCLGWHFKTTHLQTMATYKSHSRVKIQRHLNSLTRHSLSHRMNVADSCGD